LSAVFLLLALTPLFPRDVEITIEDMELGIPLEGALIRSWDGREYICDGDGKALVSAPDGRPVTVQAAYPGYESARLALALGKSSFTLGLRLSGIMEGRELVIEAPRPGTSETRTGRSVAVTERQIAQTGEIGLIEDVMTTIKLLPGVGYTGMFNALPSIRGGEPGDMSASLDGYYISNPYHWGGGYSIFDPRMVQSAQLSHGIFSSRYGHTVSGLLEVSSKRPSSTETEFELGLNTSAANANLSLPLFGRGGIIFMGRVTYYDPVVALAKQTATVIPELEVINSVRVAPYIRSGAVVLNYRFFDNLELQSTAFWGMDGVGVHYKDGLSTMDGLTSSTDMLFDYTNYLGFITAGLSWNPRSDMLLKTTLGTGYHQSKVEGDMRYFVSKYFSRDFLSNYPTLALFSNYQNPYELNDNIISKEDALSIDAQGRVDFDWELSDGLVAAYGVQEMFTNFNDTMKFQGRLENFYNRLTASDRQKVADRLGAFPVDYSTLLVNYLTAYSSTVDNKLFSTSAYTLVEYTGPGKRFGSELGLRLDHFYLLGKGFSVSTTPVLNPRLNLDFNVFRNRGFVESFDISAGTGLFSSVNDMIALADERFNLDGAKPGRSWTSVLGGNIAFPGGLSLNVEAYYKYIFDRAYIPIVTDSSGVQPTPFLDGEGRIWGIDLMLQKLQSRYWDGWLSYSFNWTKYRDPNGANTGFSISGGSNEDGWYFPSYHRFHNLNLIVNIKPIPRINLYTRFGIADGTQLAKIVGPITSYPVYILEDNMFIEEYRRATVADENNRTTPSFPLDIKFSILGNNEAGKSRYEVYVAVENTLALLYTAQGNTTFNTYTGKEDTGSNSASYELPIPIPSFGFKLNY
jgi:hypothetical protein